MQETKYAVEFDSFFVGPIRLARIINSGLYWSRRVGRHRVRGKG
jgi:hypothetical protein